MRANEPTDYMTSVRFYAGVYVALLVLVTMKVVFFELVPVLDFWTETLALALTMLSAVVEALLIAGYFQHLRSEPRSITYLYLSALFAAMLVTFAAAFSIT